MLMLTGSLAQLIWFSIGVINLWTLLLPVGVIYFGMIIQFIALSSYITSKMTDRPSGSAMMTFFLQKVRPRTWWEAAEAKRATRLAVTIWVVLLALLLGLMLSRGFRPV